MASDFNSIHLGSGWNDHLLFFLWSFKK